MLNYYSQPLHKLLDSIDIPFDISPLVDAIRLGKAVVYVGAGASVPVGLPTWNAFLNECFVRAKKTFPDASRWSQTARLLKEGDYLTGADLLQKEIGQSLEHYVWDIFGHAHIPSPIHFAIARIPFSLAVSTNYDRLLESAYQSRPNVWTWRDPAALFSAIKHARFSIVKVHGDVGNGPSLVLTKTQYRDLMHLNKAFNDCLTTLLSLRTFLFVGSSLRDHDLLRLMDNAKLTYGSDFGPHFAILFDDEFDDVFSRLLQDSYNINVILCKKPEPASDTWKTESVCSVLKDLSGKVAKEFNTDQRAPMDSIKSLLFSLTSASQALLERIVLETGSNRGTIAFVKDFDLPGLFVAAQTEAGNPADISNSASTIFGRTRFGDASTLVRPTDFLGVFFLQGTLDGSHYYRTFSRDDSNGTTPASPFTTHSEVQSLLACHIVADGRTVGVISIESFSKDAYTADHMEALRQATFTAAMIYMEYRHRNESKRGISKYLADMESFHMLMDISRALKPLHLSYLLYDIDYGSGWCEAKYAKSIVKTETTEVPFGYWFDEKSLVTTVLEVRKRDFIVDAAQDLVSPSPHLSKNGVVHFNISGPVVATPIRVGGYTASILICWSRKNDRNKDVAHSKERVERIARLIANAPKRSAGPLADEHLALMTHVDEELAKVDHNEPWTKEMRGDPRFRQRIIDVLLASLLHGSCGLARVRLWQCDVEQNATKYVVTHSLTLDTATMPDKKAKNAYVDTECPETDPFCQYTIERSKVEPLAVWQNASMFGLCDKNTPELDKDPSGSWIVGPIVFRKRLLGFVSADTHYPDPDTNWRPKERQTDEETRVFQCCAVDVITDILTSIIRINALTKKRSKESPSSAAKEQVGGRSPARKRRSGRGRKGKAK